MLHHYYLAYKPANVTGICLLVKSVVIVVLPSVEANKNVFNLNDIKPPGHSVNHGLDPAPIVLFTSIANTIMLSVDLLC